MKTRDRGIKIATKTKGPHTMESFHKQRDTNLNKLQRSVLDFLVRILQVQVENVKYFRFVNFTPTDLVVFQLVSETMQHVPWTNV